MNNYVINIIVIVLLGVVNPLFLKSLLSSIDVFVRFSCLRRVFKGSKVQGGKAATDGVNR